MNILRPLALLGALVGALPALAESYSLNQGRITGGGGISAGGTFALLGTLGQAEAGMQLTGGAFSLLGGLQINAAASLNLPILTEHPAIEPVAAGDAAVLAVGVWGAGPVSYQWLRNGAPVPGATGSTYLLPSAQSFHAGTYSVKVTNSFGAATSRTVTLEVTAPPPSAARLLNLSARSRALTGDDVLIPGFVVQGAQEKRLLIRAVGPTLGGFGITDPLPNPRLILRRQTEQGSVDVAANDDWGDNANSSTLAATAALLGAFDLEAGGKDAALLLDLSPGAYTVVCDDAAGGSGIAIVEFYDADAGAEGSRLINISNRGFVGTGGNIMIPGFVVSSEGAKTFLIRVVGPTLAGFGLDGVLNDPRLDIFRAESDGSSTLILSNDDWGETDAAHMAAVVEAVGAFDLDAGSKDAALAVALPPGAYTIQASGGAGATGLALVEIYEVP